MRRPVHFGLNIDPSAGGLAITQWITAIADHSGIEYAGIQDHPYNPGFLDMLSPVTHLAARTRQVHFFSNVANLPLRPPAMPAKQAASVDVLSDGRFELGLGAGVDTLTTLYTDYGMDTFVFWPSADRERQSRLVAEQVAPAVRKALASG